MRHDVVVVGSGSAGSVVAARLSEDPAIQVCLIEAGPDFPNAAAAPPELRRGASARTFTGYTWGYLARATVAQDPSPLPRGRVLGGTGTINGSLYVRALAEDFERWVSRGCPSWGPETALQIYRRMENDMDQRDELHGTAGPMRVRRYPRTEWLPLQSAFHSACVAAGFPDCPDMNAPGTTGVGSFPLSDTSGLTASTASAYLEPSRTRPNLRVQGDTTVRRLIFDRTGHATGVEIVFRGELSTVSADIVVLCAGAIGTPRILQSSGFGPEEILRKAGVGVVVDLPGVGKCLRDHQVVEMRWAASPVYALPASDAPTTQLALRYTAAGSDLINDMKITARSLTKAAPDGSAPEGPAVVALVPDLELAMGSGEVRIVSPDPDSAPSIDLHFLDDTEDQRRLREGVELAMDLSRHPDLARLLGQRLTPCDNDLSSSGAIDRWLMRAVRTSHHLCGSAKMGGPSDALAVADERGRLRGADNVRIADASLFPDVVRANVNATVILVADRVAELLRADLQT